jgi:capsular exopolysaccharide synthesis family protein
MTARTESEVDLRRLPAIVLRRAPVLLVAVLLAVGGVFVYSSSKPDQYAATAKVRLLNPNREEIFDGNLPLNIDPAREANTQIQLIRSPELRDEVERFLGPRAGALGALSVSAVDDADILEIRVTSPSAVVARDGADAFAQGYVDHRRAHVLDVYDERSTELRRQASALDAQIAALSATDPTREGLIAQQNAFRERAAEFDVDAALRTGDVEVAQDASLPTTPFSPQPLRDAVLAGLLVALLGAGIVLVVDRLDDRLRTAEEAETVLGVPILGSIPIHADGDRGRRRVPRRGSPGLVDLDSAIAEAYQGLQTSLRFSGGGKARRALAITSPGSGEGKTTITANLAVMLAESGLNVAVVSADLRKPTIGRLFGVSERSQPGLTSVLLGDTSVGDAIVPVELASGRRLVLLPTGATPHNPSELLSAPEFGKVLRELEEMGADFILVDCPPVLAVSDPLAVSQHVDGLILVGFLNRTRKADLTETMNRLEQVDADVLGAIVNGLPTRGPGSRYAYRYGYGVGEKYGE